MLYSVGVDTWGNPLVMYVKEYGQSWKFLTDVSVEDVLLLHQNTADELLNIDQVEFALRLREMDIQAGDMVYVCSPTLQNGWYEVRERYNAWSLKINGVILMNDIMPLMHIREAMIDDVWVYKANHTRRFRPTDLQCRRKVSA